MSEMRQEVLVKSADNKRVKIFIYGSKASFAYLNEPDEQGKYRSQFILPKNTKGMKEVLDAITAFGKIAFPKGGFKRPVLKDGDNYIKEAVESGKEADSFEIYKDSYFFTANSPKNKPDVRGECYSGAYVAAIITIAPYDVVDEKTKARSYGLKGYIDSVVWQADGERIGGVSRMSADELGISMPDPLAKTENAESKYDSDVPF